MVLPNLHSVYALCQAFTSISGDYRDICPGIAGSSLFDFWLCVYVSVSELEQ